MACAPAHPPGAARPLAPPAVALEHVSQVFRGTGGQSVTALRDISLEVAAHSFTVIVGPSGCGKSTVLRMVAGLLPIRAGTGRIFGHPIERPRDDTAMVFQRPALLPWLTVTDNLLFPLRHRGRPVTGADRDRAARMLETIGLQDFARSFPGELSGGMQQRVGIGRALLGAPSLLLMDEPFSALDALTRDEMSFELLRLRERHRSAVLFITHSIPEAVLLADRICVMSARPGTIRETIEVDLPAPRGPQTLRLPRFHDLCEHLRALLTERA